MKTEIKYEGPEAAKRLKALDDIKSYLGAKRFKALSIELGMCRDPKAFTTWCGFAGIEGFPVIVWYETLMGEKFVWSED